MVNASILVLYQFGFSHFYSVLMKNFYFNSVSVNWHNTTRFWLRILEILLKIQHFILKKLSMNKFMLNDLKFESIFKNNSFYDFLKSLMENALNLYMILYVKDVSWQAETSHISFLA